MKKTFCLPSVPFACLAALFVAAVLPSRAQVTASLVADVQAIQPGKPLQAALRLEHAAGWHTYWSHPGTGYPTSLTWTLPDGWTAGKLSWPAPKTITDESGHVTGQGYDGVVYLPVTLTPPKDLPAGNTVAIKAKAEWLMCHDACVPGESPVELDLPVSASASPALPDPVNGPAIAATLATLPRADSQITVTATRDAHAITLRLTGLPQGPANTKPSWWFFTDNDLVAYDQPQSVRVDETGTVTTLTLPLAEDATPATTPATAPASTTTGSARVQGVLRASPSAATDAIATASVPSLSIDVPLQSPAPAPHATDAPAGLLATLPLAFIGGLILNLMPCVFPVLGIKIMGFVNQAGASRRKITLHGLTFTAGVLLSFWTLATVLAILRASGGELGWGFQLQSPPFVFGLAALMLVFALSMSGVFEFGGRAMGAGASLQMQSGYRGSFFTGVLATVVATPCSAPFLAPALGVALVLPAAESYVIFTTIGLGLSTPYLLLSIFPQAVRLLPRPGAWMETFKQAMAFPLYATAGYLVWVLAGQANESGSLMAIFGLTLIAMAAWIYGRYAHLSASARDRRIGLIGGALLLGLGVLLGWPKTAPADEVTWEPWSPTRVAVLQAEGRPIYVDFTARWCATCQANKKLVFGSSEVRSRFHELGVVVLRGDWTSRDARITTELAKWNRSAVPFNLVYLPGRTEPTPLPELLTPGLVIKAFDAR